VKERVRSFCYLIEEQRVSERESEEMNNIHAICMHVFSKLSSLSRNSFLGEWMRETFERWKGICPFRVRCNTFSHRTMSWSCLFHSIMAFPIDVQSIMMSLLLNKFLQGTTQTLYKHYSNFCGVYAIANWCLIPYFAMLYRCL
jgi:hypothetical protein